MPSSSNKGTGTGTGPGPSRIPKELAQLRDMIHNSPFKPTGTNRTVTHAFLVGYTVNYIVDSLLPALLRRKSVGQALKGLFTRVALQGGAALALFSAVYTALLRHLTKLRLTLLQNDPSANPNDFEKSRDRLFARLVRTLRSGFLVPFLAAALASPLSLLLPIPSLRQQIALWVFTKGIEATYQEARKCGSRSVAWVPDWVGGAFFYAIGNGQLLTAFLFEPDAFPSSYGKVIMARSTAYIPQRPPGLPASIEWPEPREIANVIADLSERTKTKTPYPSFSAPLLSALTPSEHPTTTLHKLNPILDYSPAHPAHTNMLCAVLHPKEPSCSRNFARFWIKEWVASARFVAIFAAIAQAFSWKKVMRDPETALFRYVTAIVQGATVISGSIGSAWGLTCFSQHYLPRTLLPRLRYFFIGVISCVFILAVPQQRRAALGSYVARMSLVSSWTSLRNNGKVKSYRNGDVLLLATGLGMLAALHEQRPRAVPGMIKKPLNYLIGEANQPDKAFLRQKTDTKLE